MKVKNIVVEVKQLDSVLKDAAGIMNKIKNNERVMPQNRLSFGSIESFREFFTPKRLELLHVIKQKQPESVYELAKLVKREIKSVVVDIGILEKYGLVDTKKINNKNGSGYKVMPVFDFDKLRVDIAM
jgi:predicted transcriptional regulator